MALSGTVLGDLMKANVDVVVAAATAAQEAPDRSLIFEAMGNAIVAHITANALVLPTALAAPSGGGPVTGTGTIT